MWQSRKLKIHGEKWIYAIYDKRNDLFFTEQSSSSVAKQNYFKKFIISSHIRKLMLNAKIGSCGYVQDTTNIFLCTRRIKLRFVEVSGARNWRGKVLNFYISGMYYVASFLV